MTGFSTEVSSAAKPVAYAASVADAAVGDFDLSPLEDVAAAFTASENTRSLHQHRLPIRVYSSHTPFKKIRCLVSYVEYVLGTRAKVGMRHLVLLPGLQQGCITYLT